MQPREHLRDLPRSDLAIICLMIANPPIPDISDYYLDNLCECMYIFSCTYVLYYFDIFIFYFDNLVYLYGELVEKVLNFVL